MSLFVCPTLTLGTRPTAPDDRSKSAGRFTSNEPSEPSEPSEGVSQSRLSLIKRMLWRTSDMRLPVLVLLLVLLFNLLLLVLLSSMQPSSLLRHHR